MDLDRPPHHRTPSASTTTTTSTPTGELFVCFTSRLSSSSSMKISKSILSPGRARDPSVSLSNSLSRRLRSNGSIKAGQASPMFPSSAKKRGSGFENPEPSSPKVTCIGQVRVKTKKKVKHSRSLRRSGDLSFRKVEQTQEGMNLSEERERDRLCLQNQRSSSVHYQQQECSVPHRNQRWVHLPLTICEALRAEFSCLFPCRSSCFSTNEREKQEKGNGSRERDHNGQQQEQRSCGAVFARWLVALQDGEGGKGREIELVVAGGDDDEERIAGRPSTTMRSSRSRRHVFEDIEFKDESFVAQKGDGEEEAAEEEEKARVSICIPPKNALLLMRCRSDPMKMAALTNRFWETPAATKNEDSDGDGGEAEVEIQKGEAKSQVLMEKECEEVDEQNVVSSVNLEEEKEEDSDEETTMEMEVVSSEKEEEEEEVKELEVEHQQEDEDFESADLQIDEQNTENVEAVNLISEEEVSITPLSTSSPINSPEQASCETEEKIAPLPLEASVQEQDVEIGDVENTEETTGHESEQEEEDEDEEEEEEESDTEIEHTTLKEEEKTSEDENVKKVWKKEEEEEEEEEVLPECLLLMMCEPKLSMEVSKETWVCSTDFIRWLPERQQLKVIKTDASDHSKKRLSTDTKKSSSATTNPAPPPENKNHHLLQPPRSSCSLPPRSSCSLPAAAVSGVSMASMIEQKLVNAVGYEPFVLTRCKSEPMRTAAKLAAEPCFWKNRKLEPHRRATFGFGAAGVGF
ncbi:glutamic acid-rich protein-like [Ipomoea triloba]|uniref:glutamic acid-rich protein-like n=1 Tax=Ipomoea triloba TaxID=35885 RepID=UPI00125DE4C5|nr:glutamic acid-rich protein-like [Ipomoea triloba]